MARGAVKRPNAGQDSGRTGAKRTRSDALPVEEAQLNERLDPVEAAVLDQVSPSPQQEGVEGGAVASQLGGTRRDGMAAIARRFVSLSCTLPAEWMRLCDHEFACLEEVQQPGWYCTTCHSPQSVRDGCRRAAHFANYQPDDEEPGADNAHVGGDLVSLVFTLHACRYCACMHACTHTLVTKASLTWGNT